MWPRRFPWLDITKLFLGDGQTGRTLDGVAEGEVRSEHGETGCFRQRDDGSAYIWSRATPTGSFLRSGGRPFCPPSAPKRSKWQDRRIIPANTPFSAWHLRSLGNPFPGSTCTASRSVKRHRVSGSNSTRISILSNFLERGITRA
jgi:hypothetical protein